MKQCQSFPIRFWVNLTPRLEDLSLNGIPFPSLPDLLLSATHLITLGLEIIPHSGFISLEAIVTALSTLTSLEELWVRFESRLSRPDWGRRHLPPSTRAVLPAFAAFWFKGVSEYLEVVVARIDTPRFSSTS